MDHVDGRCEFVMAILKLKRDPYINDDAVTNLVNYVLNEQKMPSRIFGGTGISLSDPAESMYKIKNAYDKATGKQVEHFILAFNQMEQRLLVATFIYEIAYEICNFFHGVQVLFAVHEVNNSYLSDDYRDNALHIHFVVNTVNTLTGNKFILNYNNQFILRDYIRCVLQNHQVSNCVQLKVE